MKELTLNLSNVDIIELSKIDVDLIKSWYFKNLNYVRENLSEVKESFHKVVISYMHNLIYKNNNEFNVYSCSEEGKWIYLYGFFQDFEEDKKDIICNNKIPSKSNIIYGENKEKINISTLPLKHIEEIEKWMGQDISIITFINAYMSLNQESIITQTRIHTKKIQSKKDKRKGKKPRVKLIRQNIIRLNTDHIQLTEEEKNHYERHTFGWTVRGHWREYQSGKKVWIKPQIRGDKSRVEGKIYEI